MKVLADQKIQITTFIPNIHLFQYLKDAEKTAMADICEMLEYDEGERIITEGELNPYLFAMISGTVSVSVFRKEKRVYVSSIGEGDIFGEAAIFMNVKRTADVDALGPVKVLRIERRKLMNFIRDHSQAGIKMLMLIIYSLLKKLKDLKEELAYERKSHFDQSEVDALMKDLFTE